MSAKRIEMRLYYGTDNRYTDITDLALKLCVLNNVLTIPAGDHERAALFGDPLANVLKNIKIEDDNGGGTVFFSHAQDITISMIDTHITNPITERRNQYWQTLKQEQDPDKKLHAFHPLIRIDFGDIAGEYPEQKMAMIFVKENSKVLEIGGNIGRNSCVIAQILENSKNLVVLESNPRHVYELTANRDQNNFHFQIEPSALSLKAMAQSGDNTIVSEIVPQGYFKINTITWTELTAKYNIDFDTLVADCEGALYFILKDMPEMLTNIRTIVMENDYWNINEKEGLDGIIRANGFKRIYVQSGGWGPCFDRFYEVWQKA